MRVLLIEDDILLAKTIELSLLGEGMTTTVAYLGEEGLSMAKLNHYNVVILDLMLPDIDGYDIIRSIRDLQPEASLLILSGLGSSEEKVRGLSYGADDYITKPFNREELVSRVKHMTYNSNFRPTKTGKLFIDTSNHKTYIDGISIHLTNKEQALIEALNAYIETPVLREDLFKKVYNSEEELEPKLIDVLAAKIVRKLKNISADATYITAGDNSYMLSNLTESRLS